MDQFYWQPGKGIDQTAMERLRRHFRKPKSPMGEAWFMSGDRRIFHELAGDLSGLSAWDIQAVLQEIANGISAFGPRPEWQVWYHYLLGQILPRAYEAFVSPLLESLMTGFFAMYPDESRPSPYAGFRNDVLLTLGQCLMEPQCWNGQEIVVGSFLHRSNANPAGVWRWHDASGDFSASMFFCLKYLPSDCVAGWLRSVLAISSPHWRAQVLVWLVGVHALLAGKARWPSEFFPEARPSVAWEWSHCLRCEIADGADFVPEAHWKIALALVRRHFTDDVFLEWLDAISGIPYLVDELAEIPSRFEEIYVRDRGK